MAIPSEMPTRKTAAIMFTDIAGFSKKLAENESRAFELLKTHDALIRVLTAKFDGKVLKSLGDSFIIEFLQAVNAVKCAVEIQKRFWNFNRGKADLDTIRLRAGIHLGEVIIRQGDILGEGITIASRIEALTEPNRICISLDVYDHVKNSLPLHVFDMGALELKDISRKVEVYEVLIDSIPELSQPSPSAKQVSSVQKITIAASREAEELREANRIEETKQRLLNDQTKADEERKKNIAAHYSRAETYFQNGQLKEAEQELAEIAKLDPQQRPPTEQQRQEEESVRVVEGHLSKARASFTEGNLDAAEEEVNEIFRLLPLHVGAQQLLMQIEEERYNQEEKKRIDQTKAVIKQISDEELKVEGLLGKVRTLLQEEKFSEATFVLHELFLIDPNHSGGRRLEETIRQAEQAKAELQRIQADKAHEEQQLQDLAKLQKKVEEQRQRQIVSIPPPATDLDLRYKRLNYLAATLIAVAAVFFGVPRLVDIIFPKTASIAILRFTNAPRDSSSLDLFDAFPVLLAEDFARCEHLTVISPSSSLLYMPEPAQLRKIASMLPVEYLLMGTIQETRGRYTILVRVLIPEKQKIAFVGMVEGPLSALGDMRKTILQKVLEKMEIRSNLPEISNPVNSSAFTQYAAGLHLLQLKSGIEIDSVITVLRTAVTSDPSFGDALGTLADAELRAFQTTQSTPYLRSAFEDAQRALRCSPLIASAHRVLAVYNRIIQNYDASLTFYTQSLTFLPQDPECYRGLALLSLTAGKLDEAEVYASKALLHDPKNPESYFTAGLVQHMRKDYPSAESSYHQAQLLGENDSLLTTNYLQNVWIGNGNNEKAVRYCQQMLRISPNDYRYYYWIGRAFQLSLQINKAQEWLEEGLALTQRIIEAEPSNAHAYTYTGLMYSRLGKFSDGEAAITKALQLDTISARILFRSANMYSVQRNKQKSLSILGKSLQREYNFSELLNPDLTFISREPEFLPAVTKTIKGPWPKK